MPRHLRARDITTMPQGVNDRSFLAFMVYWNMVQGNDTPDIHAYICSVLEKLWAGPDKKLLLMAFRGCGKSTLVGLFCAWVLMTNPDMRILVVSADDRLAAKMVRNVRRIIERHPHCAYLVPSSPDQWAADRFTVNRTAEWRDPSMMSVGMAGNMTGMRADMVICDDVEVPNTTDTPNKRDELRTRLRELSFIQTPGAHSLYVGTPHAFDTIYATAKRMDIQGHQPFLPGYTDVRIPILDQDGNSLWPERFSNAFIRDIERTAGPSHFQSQMMLRPVNITLCHLDPGLAQIYDDPLVRSPFDGALYLGDERVVWSGAWWDPSLAEGRGDSSVLAIVLTGENGHTYLHSLTYIQVDDTPEIDNATAQCRQVVSTLERNFQTIVGVETNGLGQLLPGLLRSEIARISASIAIHPKNHTASKDTRIINAFETVLAARMFHVHRTVFTTPFFDEMRGFKVGKTNRHDDGLDAVAGAMMLAPPRAPSVPSSRRAKQYHIKS